MLIDPPGLFRIRSPAESCGGEGGYSKVRRGKEKTRWRRGSETLSSEK